MMCWIPVVTAATLNLPVVLLSPSELSRPPVKQSSQKSSYVFHYVWLSVWLQAAPTLTDVILGHFLSVTFMSHIC